MSGSLVVRSTRPSTPGATIFFMNVPCDQLAHDHRRDTRRSRCPRGGVRVGYRRYRRSIRAKVLLAVRFILRRTGPSRCGS